MSAAENHVRSIYVEHTQVVQVSATADDADFVCVY